MCQECYSNDARITPLLKPFECLKNHTQYICGTCGRCICIEKDPKRGLQRWNFPFQSLAIAKLYLRTADYTMKRNCGIYKIENEKGRKSYKIFVDEHELHKYLQKNQNKRCVLMKPIYQQNEYREYTNTQVRKLTPLEIEKYMGERYE